MAAWENAFNDALATEMSGAFEEASGMYAAVAGRAGTAAQRARAWVGTANCARHRGGTAANLSALLAAAEADPTWPQTYFLLSAHHVKFNNLEEAVRCLFEGLGKAMAADAVDTDDFETAYTARPGAPPATRRAGAASLIDLLYAEGVSPPHVRLLHAAEGQAAYRGPFVGAPGTGVCFVSEHFRRGSVASMFLPVLRELATQGLELHLWSLAAREDDVTRAFREVPGVTFWTSRPHAMRIAVCLDGRTGTGAALHELGLRLAPVQVDWLGYPYTTGSPAIDVKVGDPFADPPGAEAEYTEAALYRLEPCMWAWEPEWPVPLASVTAPPATDAPRILVCQNFKKVRPAFLAACTGVLLAVPGATVHFRCTLRADARAVFDTWILKEMGAVADRVRYCEPAPAEALTQDLMTYHLALDTWPYNGAVTTAECLYAGLPVVTCLQGHHRGRTTGSLLTAAGLPELVAADARQFVDKAVALLTAPAAEAAAVRGNVARRARASPVMRPCVLAGALAHMFSRLA